MKKSIDKDTVTDPDFVVNSELLFCSDALVVDYLNALLASEPALNMDFREIHFVHKEITPNSIASSIVTNAMFIESDTSKSEADALRSENESLKFKTELASIDAQVLRNENSKLKIEKERLVAQLSELKVTLKSMQAENDSIKEIAEAARHQLDTQAANSDEQVLRDENNRLKTEKDRLDTKLRELKVKLETMQAENDSLKQIAEEARHQIDTQAAKIKEQDQKMSADTINSAAIATVENILSVQDNTVGPIIPKQEAQQESASAPDELRNDHNTSIPTNQERLVLSPVTIPSESVKSLHAPAVTVSSSERVLGVTSGFKVQPLSKAVKQHPVEIHHARQTVQVEEDVSQNPAENSAAAQRTPNLSNPPLQDVAEVPNNQESDAPSDSLTSAPLFKGDDEITMPDAPVPKVVIRRNIKYYEDLQKEADSSNKAETDHKFTGLRS